MTPGTRKFIDYSTGVIQKVSSAPVQPVQSIPSKDSVESLYNRVQQLSYDVNSMLGQVPPGFTDFFNITTTVSPTTVRLTHNYGCLVRYSFLDINDTSVGYLTAIKNSETDANTLVLDLYFVGTLTVRVEPAV
jgi:hypothetical protein